MTTEATTAKMRPDLRPEMLRHFAIQYDKYVKILYTVSPEPPLHTVTACIVLTVQYSIAG